MPSSAPSARRQGSPSSQSFASWTLAIYNLKQRVSAPKVELLEVHERASRNRTQSAQTLCSYTLTHRLIIRSDGCWGRGPHPRVHGFAPGTPPISKSPPDHLGDSSGAPGRRNSLRRAHDLSRTWSWRMSGPAEPNLLLSWCLAGAFCSDIAPAGPIGQNRSPSFIRSEPGLSAKYHRSSSSSGCVSTSTFSSSMETGISRD